MDNPFKREASRAAVRAALAAYLSDIWLSTPEVVAVTVDMQVDKDGNFSVIASVCDRHDVQIVGEVL